MKDISIGQLVYTKCGRDKGRPFIVVNLAAAEEDYVFLVDGELRPVAKPKKKKIKHLQPTNTVIAAVAEQGERLTDSDIKKLIKAEINDRTKLCSKATREV